jgi:hypothetical protein
MEKPSTSELVVAALYGLVGWSVAAAAMSLALWKTPAPNAALSAHAVVVPVAFMLVSFVYFRRASALRALPAALLFGVLVLVMDTITSAAFGRAADPRTLVLGAWLPAYAAVLATWIAGLVSPITFVARRPR